MSAGKSLIYEVPDMDNIAASGSYDIMAYKTDTYNPVMSMNRDQPGIAYKVHFPTGTSAVEPKISASKSRIVWLIHRSYASTLERILHRLIPHYAIRVIHEDGLWISTIMGRDMREIGSITKPGEDDEITDLQWLPDEKHVSFAYRNALYVTSVD
jgi:hypothetical protein